MTDWTSVSFVVVDVEGNGQQPPDLVEVAAVPIVGGVIGEPVSWLVRPESPIKFYATRIHGLTNQDVADCPTFETVKVDVLHALSHPALIAHNAHVDLDVLQRKMTGWEPPEVFDTLKLARRLVPGQRGYRLGELVEAFGLADGLPDDLSPHRATYDALVAARLFVLLATKAHDLEELRSQRPGEGEDEHPALF
ncbi:exonuclease domain-containing protein [Streptomyces hainanensis]|uniref:3'-5' exonuclease n=1 Tax=Streptomyces hainanensis TaxID=402648 RepID=A0A4V2Y4D6_9ACTN|nr:exonuclease domain-containing protein [Streptomyces hainanensis]TDC79965.1 3'-5' exonuclease [Streptomyces hainanensis]